MSNFIIPLGFVFVHSAAHLPGFAMVVDEVRNLAQKSAEAAKNTTDLIAASMTAVGKGVQLTQDTTTTQIHTANQFAQEIVQMVDEIAASAQEQTSSIQQVSGGVNQIASVVHTNSAAEESAAASQEFSSQAEFLKELASQFQLSEESDYTSCY